MLRILRAEPLELSPVRSKTATVQDADGNYRQVVGIDSTDTKDKQPRLVTVEAVVAYRDLDLPRGTHRLVFEVGFSGQGFEPIVAKSDIFEIVVSDQDRPVAAASADDLTRWQIPEEFAPPQPRAIPLPLPGRIAAGGFDSESNLPQARGFLAEVQIAEIHFATNRAANPNLPPTVRAEFVFTARSAAVSYGTCRVQVLRRSYDEKKAVRQRPLSFGELQNYFSVLETRLAPRDAWAGEFAQDDVLLYVHGYRNSFEDALLRATQLQLDLDFPGQMVAFSWPSLGLDVVPDDEHSDQPRMAYFDDVQAADASIEALVETLQTLAAANSERRIHVVAHSLGNRLLLAALRRLADEGTGRLLDQVVLAAPDVTVDELLAAVPALAKLSHQPTLYSSTKDVALLISTKLLAARLGDASQRAGCITRCYQQLDTITADRVNSLFAMNGGHCYFAEAPQMVQELRFVLCQRLPPDQRTTLNKRACSESDERSWELRR